jgi:hypothetical protein
MIQAPYHRGPIMRLVRPMTIAPQKNSCVA